MNIPVKISYRHMDKSDAVERAVLAKAAHLERTSPDIQRCDVVVEAPHRQHRQGNIFHVRIHLTLPWGEIIAGRDPEKHHAHEDVFVAVRDAFTAARRALMELVRSRRGEVKTAARLEQGKVTRLLSGEGPGLRFGFLETRDGREVYFHERSVIGDFDRLARGTSVRFAEETGEQGPQASTVRVTRAH